MITRAMHDHPQTAPSLWRATLSGLSGSLVGIVTDGDLRRHMGRNLMAESAGTIMTRKPKTIRPGAMASAALEMINAARITALFVVDRAKPVGIIHVHDLLRTGVV